MATPLFIFLIIVIRHITPTTGQACNPGQSEYDGSCYQLAPSETDFYSSKSSCEDLGMHLVYIGSQEEQNFLVNNVVSNKEYWIGLSSVTWLDGSSLTYHNMPDSYLVFNQEAMCFRMYPWTAFEWYDDDCLIMHHYICEKEEGCNSDDSDSHEYDPSCYHFSQSESDFDTSKSHCEDLGMHLVYIGSQSEQEFLVNSMTGLRDYWIGLSSFTWLDQSRLTYENFGSDSFDGQDGICFYMKASDSFIWVNHDCTHSHDGICEKELGQGPTASVQETDTTPATTTEHATEMTTATCSSTSMTRDKANSRFKKFKLLFNNVALVDAFVRSSHSASSLIQCSQWCLRDTHCSCFTFISSERLCLLGKECPMSADIYEERHGAKTYSTVHEDRECFSEDDNIPVPQL